MLYRSKRVGLILALLVYILIHASETAAHPEKDGLTLWGEWFSFLNHSLPLGVQ